ncbi:MAG: metallophosphoesterase [Saprospiraceae bacterium]|nr:metallophosphoesterase [Saprospiraceae bacterium]
MFWVIFSIILLMLFSLDYYVYQGVRVLFSSYSPMYFKLSSTIYWIVCLSLPLLFFYYMFQGRQTHQLTSFGVFLGNLWLVFLITKIVFFLFLFGEDIYRLLYGSINNITNNNISTAEDNIQFLPSRRKFVSQVALGVAAVPFLSLIYGIFKGRYDYKIHKHDLAFKDLPEAFDGFTITQISDVHCGSFDEREGVIKGLDLIHQLKSDLIVFTGDLVNTFSHEFDPWIEDFKKLKAPYGQYSILGNHDYGEYAEWANAQEQNENFEKIKNHHSTIGFKLLEDASVKINKDGQYIQLLGVHNWGKGFGERGNVNKALNDVIDSDFKILLSHDPTHWEHQVKNMNQHIHLTLSGHTHGMQMGVELPGFRWSPVQYRYPKWAGLYEENDKFLYINRGFGVLGFRGRAGIWPEITQITLRRA